MNSAFANAGQGSLPQLSGRLLWLYRACWCALGIGALVASSLTPLQPGAIPFVVALRLAKSAVLVCVASILLYRRQRDPVAALLALAFLTWTITSSLDFGTNAEFARLLDRCRFLLFALALLLFPDGSWTPRWTRHVAVASAGVFLVGVGEASDLLRTNLFLPLAIPCILAGIGSLVLRFRGSRCFALKQQLKWVALGLVAGVGLILSARAGSVTSSSRASVTPILWEAMFQVGIIIVALGFLVSLLRYRLFDAETVITRSAAYAGLTIALVASFGGTEALIQNVGQLYLGMNIGSVSGGMAAAVAAVLLQPLHERITDWAEARFQPDLAQLKREMPELLARLSSTNSTRHLGATVLPHINMAIHATRSAIVLGHQVMGSCGVASGPVRAWWRNAMKGAGHLIERDSSDLLFPVRLPLGKAPSGSAIWLLIGPRPDGTLYGREDLNAVRSTFPRLKNALTSALMREALDAAVDRREKRLRMELSEIRTRLGEIEAAQAISTTVIRDQLFKTQRVTNEVT
jgi:hypothetical protein